MAGVVGSQWACEDVDGSGEELGAVEYLLTVLIFVTGEPYFRFVSVLLNVICCLILEMFNTIINCTFKVVSVFQL